MANSDNAYGFRAIRHRNGAPYNGAANIYHVPASYGTALFVGDPVIKSGTADSNGIPGITIGSAGGPITGVIVGFITRSGNTNQTVDDSISYSKASTEGYALVCDDPDVIFSIQDDGATAFTAATIGLNASFVAGSGSTTSGLSGYEIDTSTEATTAGLELKILRLLQREDNEIAANAEWEVMINDHTEAHGTAGI